MDWLVRIVEYQLGTPRPILVSAIVLMGFQGLIVKSNLVVKEVLMDKHVKMKEYQQEMLS